ncbi:MAG: TonB-dependent receptor domain-containing protein [bacterium]
MKLLQRLPHNRHFHDMLFLLSLLISPFQVFSEDTHTAKIIGQVLDKNSRSPLAHVQVFIESINRGDVTNSAGEFQIEKIPPGRYDLTFKIQGYQTQHKKDILISPDETLEFQISMTTQVIEFDEVLFTATRHRNRAFEVPQLVSIVGAEAIQKRNQAQTPELLREEVGVVVQKTNQGGGSPIIRGLKANKLLFLVDGIRMNNATYRGGNIQYLNTVASRAIEKVEIVHGPISVMYGSDALGGAINVMTRQPILNSEGGYHFRGAVSGGLSTADHTQNTHLSLMSANSKFGVLLEGYFSSFGNITRGSQGGETLMRRLQNDSRTQRVLNKTQSPNDYDAFGLNSKVLLNLSETQQLMLAYQLNRQSAVPRYDVVEARKDSIRLFDPQERDLAYIQYFNQNGNKFFNNVKATLSFHRQFELRRRQTFGSEKQTADQFQTWTTGLQVEFNKILAEHHHLVYGSEIYFDKVSSKSYSLNTQTTEQVTTTPLFPDGSSFLNYGLFVQDSFQPLKRWQVFVGGRFSAAQLKAPFAEEFDRDVDFGTIEQTTTAFTGSLGSQFSVNENLKLSFNLAQGFRTPNLDDVSKLGPGKGASFYDVPNPDAGPEKTLSLDLGLKFHSGQLEGNLFGYYNYVTDLLIRKPAQFNGSAFVVDGGDTLLVFHKENAGKAYTAGMAANFNYRVNPELLLFGNLSYTYGQNVSDSEPLSAIPPLNGLLGIRWQRQHFWAELHSRFSSAQSRLSAEDQLDLRIPEGGSLGWFTLTFRSEVPISQKISLKIAVANIFDRNYREHLSGFNAPGRNFILGLDLQY